MNESTPIPAHIFVGSTNQLEQIILQKLQREFCTQKNQHCLCNQCRNLKREQHPDVVWIAPEKRYVVEDIAIIFKKITFALAPNRSFFFIIKQAHLLTPVCANRLLKTLEEPPAGYQFFLLTNNEHAIISTIRSRCSIHHMAPEAPQLLMHPLLSFFIDPHKLQDAFHFEQTLKKEKISEAESVNLLYDLTNSIQRRILEHHKKNLAADANYNYLKTTATFLQKQLLQPPQPGSSALFWKKLFLTFPRRP